MADNKTFQSATPATLPANTIAATKEVSFSGNTTDVQLIEIVAVTGSEGSRTLNEISTADGVLVNASATNTLVGAVTETAPATDTASSGLNGRLQRIAQRITSLITAIGSPFQAGGSIGNTTFASTQSGTWTVQPGNTANTTAWKVDGSAVTQPVSAASLPLPTGASTLAEQQSQTTHLATIAGDTTDIETAVELIDDTVATLGTTTYTEATTKGLIVGAVRRDADTPLADTTNELSPFITDARGALKVEAFSGETLPVSLASVPSHAVTNAGTFAVQVDNTVTVGSHAVTNAGTFAVQAALTAGTNTNEVVGDIAHDTGVGGNPVQIAGEAKDMDDTAPPNQVSAESDTTRFATDRDGAQFVHPHGPRIWSYHLDTSSAQTDTSVHSAPASGLSLYVTDIVFSHDGSAAINIFFEEGSTKVLGPFYLPATAGGFRLNFATPKKITAATALTVTTSASHAQAIEVTGFTAQG